VDHEKKSGTAKNSPIGPQGELLPDPAVDEFLTRLQQDMRHPRPGTEAIAAALQAAERLALEADSEESADLTESQSVFRTCMACGSANRGEHRFCATCGVPLMEAGQAHAASPAKVNAKLAAAPGQHHYHHHYHHHYLPSSAGSSQSVNAEQGTVTDPIGREPAARVRPSAGATGLSRAEAAVRKLSQDWVQACNTKQLDDLVDLYVADATVLRSNVPPVRGTAAIREFFFGVLEAGLGEVELEALRVELFGDVAYEAGRCKMLVPIAMGKRREERGKYLITVTRQSGSEWKIVADCWSSDLSLGVTSEPAAKPSAPSAGTPSPRPARKP
jgi:ketosteroid isomerase-like protein